MAHQRSNNGTTQNPLMDRRAAVKADAAVGAAARRLDEILAMIRGFENVNDVSQLTRMLVPAR